MVYFKFTYMLSGKYKSIYRAKILLWQNSRVKIRDEDGREHVLKEEYIRNITKVETKNVKPIIQESLEIEQQELFK